MPKSDSPEFRRTVLDLLKAGRSVADVTSDPGVTAASDGSVNRRRRSQELIETGQRPGISNTGNAELTAQR